MFAHNARIDASVQADVKPTSGEQNGLTAEVLRLAQRPSYGMRRRQIVYELRNQLGAAGLHVGTNDLFELAEEIIRREETTKDGCVVDRGGLTAQASDLTRSVPPTGMRLSRILEQFRVHARSVGRQIGPDALRDYVEEIIRQDTHDEHYRES